MVNASRLLGLLNLLFFSQPLWALQLTLESPRVVYGKMFFVRISSDQAQADFNRLDLSPLAKDFVIGERGELQRDDKGTRYVDLRVYARHTGELQIPALSLQGQTSSALNIVVHDALEKADHRPLRVDYSWSDGGDQSQGIWQRQQQVLQARLYTPNGQARIEVDRPQQAGLDGADVTYTLTESDTPGLYVFQVRWSLRAQQPGEFAWQFPPLKYFGRGGASFRFYPPLLQRRIKALPMYLPADTPVGDPGIRIVDQPGPLLFSERLYFVRLTMNDSADTRVLLDRIRDQLRSNKWFEYLPVQAVSHLENSGVHYLLPFLAHGTGVAQPTRLRVQYFDADQGKLVTRYIEPGRHLVIAPWQVYLLTISMLYLAFRYSPVIWRWMKRYYRRACAYRQTLHELRCAKRPIQVKQALMHVAEAEHGKFNLTLERWLREWQAGESDARLTDAVNRLQAQLYARYQRDDLQAIAAVLIESVQRRKPLFAGLLSRFELTD